MATRPEVGESGGQQYDVERAIQTFLQQMAEGCPNVVPAVIKELLQNADDAGATEVAVVLDERIPPAGLPIEYRILYQPAILVRNNAPFRLPKDVDPGEIDDFSALCEVAGRHKLNQVVAAGRFGIGFNSVYFLTDTPVVFSRREVHIFDVQHHIFAVNGWRFRLEQFPSSADRVGPIKNALEWMLPKKVLGESLSFGDFAMDSEADYRQALLRLPLRQRGPASKGMYLDTFESPEVRLDAVDQFMKQTAQSVLFLKSIETISFAILRDPNAMEEIACVRVTPNPQQFKNFLEEVNQSHRSQGSSKLSCEFDREIRCSRIDEKYDVWTFRVKHVARFDDPDLRELRRKLERNDERATPWASLAIPKDSTSMRLDGSDLPSWRVFLPLNEPGPCGCVLSAALFVGPSRQKSEYRTDRSDEALRKTQWNQALVEKALVPLLSDASTEVLDFAPELIEKQPKDYLLLFPLSMKVSGSYSNLTEYFRACFNQHPWVLELPDIWNQLIELTFDPAAREAGATIHLESVPEWLVAYRHSFTHLSTRNRRFVRLALGEALRVRISGNEGVLVHPYTADVVRSVLSSDEKPNPRDLRRLLDRLAKDDEPISSMSLEGLWCFQACDGNEDLIRYDPDTLYVYTDDAKLSEFQEMVDRLGLVFNLTRRVFGAVGLPAMDETKRREIVNVVPEGVSSTLEMLRRVDSRHGHDSYTNPYELVPLVDFLCSVDKSRLGSDLRLSFLVRTAQHQHERRATGLVAIKPTLLSEEDEDAWNVFFKVAFPEIESQFAENIQRLISHAPGMLGCLADPQCKVALTKSEDCLGLLLMAQQKDPAMSMRLQRNIDRHVASDVRRRASVERAVAMLFAQAERGWEEFESSYRATFFSLPVHRRSDGSYKPLISEGEGLNDVGRYYRLQSQDDVQDAPIQLPEVELLQAADLTIKRFYRKRLGLEEHGRTAVLKEVLRQVGTREEEDVNRLLLTYLARHFRESVEDLEASPHDYDRSDAAEIRQLLTEARTVPCIDGEWRAAADCVDAREVANRLSGQGWAGGYQLQVVVARLFPGENILSTDREIGAAVRSLYDLPLLSPRTLAEKALTSDLSDLDLKTRIKVLLDNWEDRPQQAVPSPVIGDSIIPRADGEGCLSGAERLHTETERRLNLLVRLFAPTRVLRDDFYERFNVPKERLDEVLRVLGIGLLKAEDLEKRLVEKFGSVWAGLREKDRLQLLEIVHNRNLIEALRPVTQDLEVVRVAAKPTWVKPDRTVAPKLLSTKPPLLGEDQFAMAPDQNKDVEAVWDAWCGIRNIAVLAREVCEKAALLPPERLAEAGKKIDAWIDRLGSAEIVVDSKVLPSTLSTVPWVLASRHDQKEFKVPGEVLVHEAAELFRQEFWVPHSRLPTTVRKEPMHWGFVTEPPADGETLGKLAQCLEKSAEVDPATALAAYKVVCVCIEKQPELVETWKTLSREICVFRLFRTPERVVTSRQLFLGEQKSTRDIGETLFCLKAQEGVPRGVEKRYRELEIEISPSAEQLVFALSNLDGANRRVHQNHGQMVRAIKTLPEEGTPPAEELLICHVRTCAGSYRPVGECYWDEELGRPGSFTAESEGMIIDATDRSSAEFCEWLETRSPGVVGRLRVLAFPEIQEPIEESEWTPSVSQVLGPWRDWLLDLARPESTLRQDAKERGLHPPERAIRIVPVERIRVEYVLDENIYVLSGESVGPTASHDCGDRILVRRGTAEESYSAPGDLAVLDRRIAEQLADLLWEEGNPTPEERETILKIVAETLERPSVVLKVIRETQSRHFLHQYQDQVADPFYAVLFEKYQKTREGTDAFVLLETQMWDILREKYVTARREQIRGHGYDEFSVFAELLQNAEDAYIERYDLGMDPPASRSASFVYRASEEEGSVLVFEHFGRPFNYSRHGAREIVAFSRDVEGVLRSAGSFKTKIERVDVAKKPVGRFGLGFKSVYLLTDSPRIHSGSWHFEIEAGCLPKEIVPPADLPPGATRIVIPLRKEVREVEDPKGKSLLRLMPFLRETDSVELRNSNRTDPVSLQVNPSRICSKENCGYVELVDISGASHIHGEKVRLIRVRHPDHSGQLGLCITIDGLPAPWDEAFESDLYVVLPLKTRLGVGVGVSHIFEIQSGRTHLVDPKGNKDRFAEVADLVKVLPKALSKLTGQANGAREVLTRFWEVWRWDIGDEEADPLRKALAGEVAALPLHHPVVPTSSENCGTKLGERPVIFFSRVPDEVQKVLIEENAPVLVNGNKEVFNLSEVEVTSEAFASAYLKACKCADSEPSGCLLRLDWEALGQGFQTTDALASKPGLLNKVAESLDEEKQELIVRSWLSESPVAAVDGSGKEVRVKPREILSPDFPGCRHLPRRLLRILSKAYSDKARTLLRMAGLRSSLTGRELREWIESGQLSSEEAIGIIRYLEEDRRWMNQTFRDLDRTFHSPWFPGGLRRLSTAEAVERYLQIEAVSWEPAFRAWLRLPILEPAPEEELLATAVDPAEVLRKLHEWWVKNAAHYVREYELVTYPGGDPPLMTQKFVQQDRSDRKRWLTLFILGSFHTLGWTTPQKNKEFLILCERKGWMDVFADPEIRADRWMGVLEQYLDEHRVDRSYYNWMRHFVQIFQVARWLEEYVESFISIRLLRAPFSLSQILVSRESELFDRGGLDAPSLVKTFGRGACFVIRELVRLGAIISTHAHRHCYVPSAGIQRLMMRLDCQGSLSEFGNRAEGSVAIHRFLVRHLGEERATFGGTFDIPLQILVWNPDLQERFLGEVLASEEGE